MDDVCRVCGLPTYLSVDRCPYCGEKYGNCREIIDYGEKYRNRREIIDYGEKYRNRLEITDRNLTNCCTVNELRTLYGLRDI